MLQNIRDNAQSTMAKVIVGLIVITFAIFGVDSIIGGLSGEPEVAKVNGESITEREFSREVELKRRQILNQMGEDADPSLLNDEILNKAVLDQLIQERVILQTADELDFGVSEQALVQQIRATPQFQANGAFDNDVFLNAIRNIGMTTSGFKDYLRKQIQVAQLRNGVGLSSFITPSQIQMILEMDREVRDVDVATISVMNLAVPEIGEAESEEFFKENRAKFKTEEMVEVQYLLVDKATLESSVEVTDDSVTALYEQEKESLVPPEERQVAHILFEVAGDVSEEDATNKALQVLQELSSGGDFGELAKKYSSDIGSRDSGGDLGMAPKGTYAKAFEETVDKLSVGEVSKPVRTEFGVHVIKLLNKTESAVPPLEQVRAMLVKRIQEKAVNERYVELNQKLADLSYESPDLVEPADVLGLTIQSGTVLRRGGKGILSSPKVIQVAFSDELVKEQMNSSPIEVNAEQTLVLHAKAHHTVREKSLDEARAEVVALMQKQEQENRARLELLSLVERIKKGETWEDLQAEYSSRTEVVFSQFKGARRGDPRLEQFVSDKVFKLAAPREGSPVVDIVSNAEADRLSLISLRSVSQSETNALSESQMAMFKNAIAGQIGGEQFQVLVSQLINQAEIERL